MGNLIKLKKDTNKLYFMSSPQNKKTKEINPFERFLFLKKFFSYHIASLTNEIISKIKDQVLGKN